MLSNHFYSLHIKNDKRQEKLSDILHDMVGGTEKDEHFPSNHCSFEYGPFFLPPRTARNRYLEIQMPTKLAVDGIGRQA